MKTASSHGARGRAAIHVHLWTDAAAQTRPEQPIRAAARYRALATTFGARAGGVTVASDITGRPRLVGPDAGEIDLSSSSTAGCLVVAVSMGRRIGIDVERVRAEHVDDDLAREALSAEEFVEFRGVADPVGFFYECWTMKEAVLKASGDGLACHPRLVRVMTEARDDGWRSVETADHRRWMVRRVEGVRGAAMAIASEEDSASPEIVLKFHASSFPPAATGVVESDVRTELPTRPSR